MGAITSVMQQALPVVGGIIQVGGQLRDLLSDRPGVSDTDSLAQQQLLDRQRQNESQASADAAARRLQLITDTDRTTKERADKLSRGLATARAYFASQGIDPNSGSAAALALSETAEAEEENRQSQGDLALQIENINRSLADLQSSNLLARTQQQQRQSFARNTRF
jgi:hypothetical protein